MPPLLLALAVSLSPCGDSDMGPAVREAVARVRAAGGGEVRLAPGEYHVRSSEESWDWVSNHDNGLPRRVFLPLRGVTNLVLGCAGGRAELVFHGLGVGIAVVDARGVVLRGLGVGWARPYFGEARLVRLDAGRPVLSFDPARFPMRVDGEGRLVAVGEGWECAATYAQAFGADGRGCLGSRWFGGCRASALGGGLFRLEEDWTGRFPRPLAPGDALVVRSAARPAPAVFLYRADGAALEDCAVRSAAGMGVLAQRCADVAVRGTGRAADATAGAFARPGSGILTSLQADATHFSNCRGRVLVEGCLFEGMVDDAVNVHSTCLQVESAPSPTNLLCRYRHPQSTGFEVFLPGERLRGIRARTLEPSERTVAVRGVRRLAPDLVELSLDGPLPDGLGAGDAVENADWQPEAVFRDNVVRGSTPRAALFTTPGRVRVEGNLFERVAAQAVHLSGDASDWFESGACRDVLVRGNVFRDCLLVGGKGVVQIDPNVPDPAAQRRRYHRNVRIEGNEFAQARGPLVYARSVSNLVFRANAVRGAGGFDVERCEGVEISSK